MGTARVSRQVLKGKSEFVELFSDGSYYKGSSFSLVVLCKADQKIARVAVCVSKKQGNAVTRNRLKRISRELLESEIDNLKPCNIAILPNRSLLKQATGRQKKGFFALLEKASLLKKKSNQQS